jgi:hypothetical protein
LLQAGLTEDEGLGSENLDALLSEIGIKTPLAYRATCRK